MLEDKIVIGITQGDTNGVGYDVLLRTLSEGTLVDEMTIVLYGSGRALAYYRRMLGLSNLPLNIVREASEARIGYINIVDCLGERGYVTVGVASREAGEHAMLALDAFFEDYARGSIDALVTLPVNKGAIAAQGIEFSGHTDYLARRCGEGHEALMVMVSPVMRVGLVTHHVPLREVPERITQALIEHRIAQMNDSLRRDFNIPGPRIAVLGLNPHAGEGGLLGSEERDIIGPAVEAANKKGYIAVGPIAADGFFGFSGWRDYDGILAMYHDQGLIPFKHSSYFDGVNYTAGLPLVRTSPAHGTAYELAGKGTADCGSLRVALYQAHDIARNRLRSAAMQDESPFIIPTMEDDDLYYVPRDADEDELLTDEGNEESAEELEEELEA